MKQLSPSPRSHPPENTSGPSFLTNATRLAHAPGVLRAHARAKSLPAAPVSLGATRPSSSTCPSVKHARPEPCVHDTFRVRIHVWHPPLRPSTQALRILTKTTNQRLINYLKWDQHNKSNEQYQNLLQR